MARNTFLGLLRSTGGRPSSVLDLNGVPTHVLRYTMAGVIQLKSSDLVSKTTVIGMLPAFMMITGHVSILSPGGTLAITLPAYKGLAEVTLRAAAAVVPGVQVAVTNGEVYGIERPVALTGNASATGLAVMGLQCFPMDDASVSST